MKEDIEDGMKGMKIALLTPTFYGWSGIDGCVKLQAERLAKHNDVWVYALEGEDIKKIKPKGYNIHYIGIFKSNLMKRIYRLFFAHFFNLFIEDLVADRDIVISHFYPMDVIAVKAKRKYGCYHIHWWYGICDVWDGSLINWIYIKLFIKEARKWISQCDQMISISNFLMKEYKRQICTI